MTIQICTLRRPGLTSHAGIAPDPAHPPHQRCVFARRNQHHFERTFPVRGVLPGSTLLTPAPRGTDPSLMDTSTGTVHMIIGGGHSTPTPVSDFDMPHDGVLITSVGPGSPQAQHSTITTTEPAPWSAYRDLQAPYGFASFDFVAHEPGGTTSITVTHYGADAGSVGYSQRDQFVMRKSLGMDRQPHRLLNRPAHITPACPDPNRGGGRKCGFGPFFRIAT